MNDCLFINNSMQNIQHWYDGAINDVEKKRDNYNCTFSYYYVIADSHSFGGAIISSEAHAFYMNALLKIITLTLIHIHMMELSNFLNINMNVINAILKIIQAFKNVINVFLEIWNSYASNEHGLSIIFIDGFADIVIFNAYSFSIQKKAVAPSLPDDSKSGKQ